MEEKYSQRIGGLIKKGKEQLERAKEQIGKKDFKKWLKRDNLIILVLSGVLLFIIAMPMESGGETEREGERETLFSGEEPESSKDVVREDGVEDMDALDENQYLAYQEKRLTEALSQVAGVGRVQVMITLKSSREMVVEREKPVSRSATNEADSQGGSRVISQVETGDSVVYRSEGTSSEPYVIKTLTPEIEGVLVVAEGAGSGTVNRTITAIVQALFDVDAHKVSVVKMAE